MLIVNFNYIMSHNVQTSLPESYPSICVPYVVDHVDKTTIHSTFKTIFGEENIERIDVVFREKPNGEKFKRVFVHFKSWPYTEESQRVRHRLLSGEEVTIVYDEPWFWKCRASHIEKPMARQHIRNAPYIYGEEISLTQAQKARSGSLLLIPRQLLGFRNKK